MWRPAPAARGAVLVIHGFGEHVGRYDHVFAALNARGYSCLGVDQRGFGRSGPQFCGLHRSLKLDV